MLQDGISLIIITQNRCDDLKKTVELLKKQNCSFPYEVLIVDQASTDGTYEYAKSFAEPFRYIKLEKNYGVSGGRNRGAKAAKFENMVFIDDDAHFQDDDALERINQILIKSDFDLFAFHIFNIEGGLYNWPYGDSKKMVANNDFVCGTFIGCGHAIKRSFFENVGGYSDELFFWGEETELTMKSISYSGNAVQYCGNINVVHRVSGDGRKTYDANRFYYQVRNRMYLYRELVPQIAFIYRLYYQFGYYLKARKNGWIKEYRQGMSDYKKMPIYSRDKLTFNQFIKYIRICKEG